MRRIASIWISLFLLIVPSSFTLNRMDYRDAMHKNVCKDLKGDVLLYFIFVDNKETLPWTEFDIRSTIDSIGVAVHWLQEQAKNNNMPLKIKSDYYIGSDYTPINKNLPQGTLKTTIEKSGLRDGLEEINQWADNIAKRAGASFQIAGKDGIPEIKNPKNKERLIAYLRDEYNVESVALLYLMNNYFRNDISVQVNTNTTQDVEFAVVSYKYPAEIAHNFLHLFGAADLYRTPFRKNEKKIKFAAEEFPRDIMQDPYASNIWDLEMGEFTRYLIGWTTTLNPDYDFLLTDKAVKY